MSSASMNVKSFSYNSSEPSLTMLGTQPSPALHQLKLVRGSGSSQTSGTLSPTGVAVAQVSASQFDAAKSKLEQGAKDCTAKITYDFSDGENRIRSVSVSSKNAFGHPPSP